MLEDHIDVKTLANRNNDTFLRENFLPILQKNDERVQAPVELLAAVEEVHYLLGNIQLTKSVGPGN